jgi:hypothetical protein
MASQGSKKIYFLQAPSGRMARIPVEEFQGVQFDVYCVDRLRAGKFCVAQQVLSGNIQAHQKLKLPKDPLQQPHIADQYCLRKGGRVLSLIDKNSNRSPFCFFEKDQSLVSSWDLYHYGEYKK